MIKHMQHPDKITRSLCGMVITTSVQIGSSECTCDICKALYNNGMKAIERNYNQARKRKMRMREFTDERKDRVQYDDLGDGAKKLIQASDIYGLKYGCVYNVMNDTFPTIEDIENIVIGGLK